MLLESLALLLFLFILWSSCKYLAVNNTSRSPILVCIRRLSICVTNPCCSPIINESQQGHRATKMYWFFLPYDIIRSRAYTITLLSVSKVIVRSKTSFQRSYLSKVRRCRYRKLTDFEVYNKIDRYHKNAIINKGHLPLVGISYCSLL